MHLCARNTRLPPLSRTGKHETIAVPTRHHFKRLRISARFFAGELILQPRAQPRIRDLRAIPPEAGRQFATDAQVIQLQVNRLDTRLEIAPNIRSPNTQASDRAPFVLRRDNHGGNLPEMTVTDPKIGGVSCKAAELPAVSPAGFRHTYAWRSASLAAFSQSHFPGFDSNEYKTQGFRSGAKNVALFPA